MITVTPIDSAFSYNDRGGFLTLAETTRHRCPSRPLLVPCVVNNGPDNLYMIGNFAMCRDGFGQRMVAEKDMLWEDAANVRSYNHSTLRPPNELRQDKWNMVHDGRFFFMQMASTGLGKQDVRSNLDAGLPILNNFLAGIGIPEVRATTKVRFEKKRIPLIVVDAPEIFITNTWIMSVLTWFMRHIGEHGGRYPHLWGFSIKNRFEDYDLDLPELKEDTGSAAFVLNMMKYIPPQPYNCDNSDRAWAMDLGFEAFLGACIAHIEDPGYVESAYHKNFVAQIIPYSQFIRENYM